MSSATPPNHLIVAHEVNSVGAPIIPECEGSYSSHSTNNGLTRKIALPCRSCSVNEPVGVTRRVSGTTVRNASGPVTQLDIYGIDHRSTSAHRQFTANALRLPNNSAAKPV